MLEGTALELSPKCNHQTLDLPKHEKKFKSKSKSHGRSPIKGMETPREDIKATPVKKTEKEDPELMKPEDIVRNRRNKVIAAIVAFLILSAIVVGVIMLVVFYFGKANSSMVTVKSQNSILTSSGKKVDTKTVAVTDQKLLGPGKELLIYVTTVDGPVTGANGRLLQNGNQKQSTIQVRDEFTDITVSYNAQKQGEVGIPMNSILSYTLSNQPEVELGPAPVQPNLQTSDGTPIISTFADDGFPPPTEMTYYTIHEQLQKQIKNLLIKEGAGKVQSSLQAYYDGQYKGQNGTFQMVNQLSRQSTDPEYPSELPAVNPNAPMLVDPTTTPVIKDIYNETEIAQAAAKVVAGVVNKIKEVMNNNQEAIESATNVKLSNNNPSNGETSIGLDQPSDMINGCNRLSDDSVRCLDNVWQSGLLQVSNPTDAVEVPALMVKMDL